MTTTALPDPSLRLRVLPDVWRPHSDAAMVAQLVFERGLARDRDVLDVFTGSGALAIAAARSGARSVTAVDISRRALLAVRLNARRNGVRVRPVRGDVLDAVAGQQFDLIVANPPYFPAAQRVGDHSVARAWDGGADGRVLVDRLCTRAAEYLRSDGRLVIVHNTMIGVEQTRGCLEAQGLRVDVLLRHHGPLGPVGRAAATLLAQRGVPVSGDEEEIVVIGAHRVP